VAFLAAASISPRALRRISCPFPTIAAAAGSAILQTLGVPACAQGKLILLTRTELPAGAGANGLGMAAFFGLCLGLAVLTQRRWPERVAIVLVAAPIALCANLMRLVGAGVLAEAGWPKAAEAVVHDAGGCLMAVVALGLLGICLWIVARLRPAPPELLEEMEDYDDDFFERGLADRVA